jgi:LacI family transcriptional regulator
MEKEARIVRTDPTMKEVAARAGVALSSVSRVLNDHPDVSDDMRSRVQRSISDLGYEPNLLASSLRRGASYTIGLIVTDIANPLFAEIVGGAERTLDAAGYAAVLTHSEGNPDRDEEMLRLLRWRQVDGLIVSIADETRAGTIQELNRFEGPCVLLDRSISKLSASAVVADHAAGMREATSHLLELKHRRIALLTGSRKLRPSRERLRAFREAYKKRRLKPPEDLIRLGSYSPDFGEQVTSDLLDGDRSPTAIIAGGNQILAGVLRTLRKRNVKVGRDIALISCDDTPLSELYSPPITVVARDNRLQGQIAAELMLERLQGKDPGPRKVVIPTELVLRESTYKLN